MTVLLSSDQTRKISRHNMTWNDKRKYDHDNKDRDDDNDKYKHAPTTRARAKTLSSTTITNHKFFFLRINRTLIWLLLFFRRLTSKQIQHSSWADPGRHLWLFSSFVSKQTPQTSQWNERSLWILHNIEQLLTPVSF